MTIYVVSIGWNIMFNDADEGRCYAGNGNKILKAFTDYEKTTEFMLQWHRTIEAAEKETRVFPRGPANQKLHDAWGFDLHDLDQDGEVFGLVVVATDLEGVKV